MDNKEEVDVLSPQPKPDGPETEVASPDNNNRIRSANQARGRSQSPKTTGEKRPRSNNTKSTPTDGINNNLTAKSSKTRKDSSRTSIGSRGTSQSRSGSKIQESPTAAQLLNILVPYSPSKGLRASPAHASASKSFSISANHISNLDKAIKSHKIFCIGGVYPAIRNALRKRGWIEKSVSMNGNPQYMRSIIGTHLNRDAEARPLNEDDTESMHTQRVLANYAPDFIWVIRRDNIPWQQLHKDQVINRFPRAFFTTKVGITACLQGIHWFSDPGVADTYFPRCYRLSMEEERQAFLDDYRLTACVGLLRWFSNNFEKFGERGVYELTSRVSCLAVDFAVRQLNNYVRMRRHEDIDWLMPPQFLSQHWEIFLTQYYNVVHQKLKLSPTDASEPVKTKYETVKKALQRLTPYWYQMIADGINNIWICKPGARSRGKGIVIMNQLEKIMGLANQSSSREANWVVQKYIEKPMLIYKTKFDMRQWFIVTDWAPLTVWFARESYVRFCTKPFSLEDFHESIHLCNNAVQCKYQNAHNRDTGLPQENMWDCYTFQAYLKTIGKLELWDKVIYPGMKQSIIGVVLASQDTADVKKNCFELYGADFMFTEDFRPWLIEINSCPCMAGSTSVTARMCAQCLEDTIKVVIDRKNDRTADTGMFEMIYRQNPASLTVSQFNANDLQVVGKKMSKDVDWPGIMTKYHARRGNQSQATAGTKQEPGPPTFADLIHKLRLKETSKIMGLTPYEQVQKSISPTTKAASQPMRQQIVTMSSTSEKMKSKTVDGKDTSTPKLSSPLSPKQQPTAKLTDAMKNTLNNNPTTQQALASRPALVTKKINVNMEKSGTIPLSYLMYNAKSNPITITDMIKQYAESTKPTQPVYRKPNEPLTTSKPSVTQDKGKNRASNISSGKVSPSSVGATSKPQTPPTEQQLLVKPLGGTRKQSQQGSTGLSQKEGIETSQALKVSADTALQSLPPGKLPFTQKKTKTLK